VELYLNSHNTLSWRGAELKRSAGTTLPLIEEVSRGYGGPKLNLPDFLV
jgi:hypothetical protein